MIEKKTNEQERELELNFQLSDPPHKVWRALSIVEFREKWLPTEALANPDEDTVKPDQEIRYRLHDDSARFLESIVTFTIAPNETGGTCLRIVHQLTNPRLDAVEIAAANTNSTPLMLAA